MTRRRLILAGCLVAVIGGGAGTALADSPSQDDAHEVCVVLYSTNHPHTTDYCVNWWVPQQ